MEVHVNGAARIIVAVLGSISAVLIALALLVRAWRNKPPDKARRRGRAVIYRSTEPRELSLLERLIDKGGLTLSIDKALWAVAGIILAFQAPTAVAALLQFARALR